MISVTIVIAAYNEGISLGAHLVSLADYLSMYGAYQFDYVIVDDGSTDETLAVARTFARFRPNVTVVSHPRNAGLGCSLRTGFQYARGEYIVTLDADMSYSADMAIELLEAIEREDADIALASPYMTGGRVVNVPWLRRILSREANRFLSMATNGRYATLTSMVRAYRTKFVTQLKPSAAGMEINPQLLFLALKSGAKVVEIPAQLRWSDDRCASASRTNLRKLAAQTMRVAATAFTFRPSLWLAVPGLFPGLLPLVVAVLFLLHVPARSIAIGTAVTVTIQYLSLGIFAGQLTAFFTNAFLSTKHRAHAKAVRS